MAARTSILLRRNPHDRDIARLAVPALGALIAEPLYVLADTAVVGRLGTEPLAGLAIASSVLLAGFAVFIFLAYGTTAAVARLLGAGRSAEAAGQAVQGLWLALGIGVVVGAGLWVGADPLVRALGASGAVVGHARTYLAISAFGVPAQLLTFAGTGYLRGTQDTRTPLAVAAVAALANLVLEVALIGWLDLGIGASAATTVLAQWGTAVVFVASASRAARALAARMAPSLTAIATLARTGGALVVRTIALRGALTLATAVAARIGTTDVAAHEIAFAVWSLFALALDAVAIAGQALIGRALGAHDVAAARSIGHRMLQLGVGGGFAVGAVVIVLHGYIPAMFSADAGVRDLAAFLLIWVAVLQPVNGAVFVLDGLLIGAGDLRFLAVAMPVAFASMAPLAISVLLLDAGIGWLWASIAVLMITRAATLGHRWSSGAWAVVGAVR